MVSADLSGKRVIVTGGSRGLGYTIAAAFGAVGADLLIVARNRDELGAAGRILRSRARPDQRIEWRAMDLQCSNAPQAILSNKWAAPDILVNNAGVHGPIGPLWEHQVDAWQRAFQINLFAPVALMRAAIPAMIARGWGRIINVSGGGATGPWPALSAYSAAKAALVRTTETVAAELDGTGVTVNAVAPGVMNTKLLQGIWDRQVNGDQRRRELLGTFTRSDEMPGGEAARLCVFLASDAAAKITGRLIAALWDPWQRFEELAPDIASTDLYTLRRIVPKDRGLDWENEK